MTTTTTRRSIRLGNPSDFRLTNDVVNEHKETKENVLKVLQALADDSEGLIIEQIEDEMWSTGAKVAGRGIVIGCGVASLILLSNPISAAASAVVIGGTVIGYAIVAGAKAYEMRCKMTHSDKIKSIYKRLTAELDKYTDSYNKVLKELDMYDIFDSGKDFKDNLKLFRGIMERAEEKCGFDFIGIEEFLTKVKKCYNGLDDDKKAHLNAGNFLKCVGALLGGVGSSTSSMADIASVADIGSAVGGIAVSASPWWEAIHGLNIIMNAGFIRMDIKKFWELQTMRKSWNAGGEERTELLKNEKFEDIVQMRDLIREIRDEIMKEGY